jgi:hypothetical protein
MGIRNQGPERGKRWTKKNPKLPRRELTKVGYSTSREPFFMSIFLIDQPSTPSSQAKSVHWCHWFMLRWYYFPSYSLRSQIRKWKACKVGAGAREHWDRDHRWAVRRPGLLSPRHLHFSVRQRPLLREMCCRVFIKHHSANTFFFVLQFGPETSNVQIHRRVQEGKGSH